MASDSSGETSGRGAARYGLVGFGLFGLVAVVLAGVLLLGNQLRPAVRVEPVTNAGGGVATAPATEAPRPLEDQIMDAYLRYWEVRKEAYLTLDPSRLPEVMADAELSREIRQIERMRSQGRAARLEAEHNAVTVSASGDRAELYDEYVNTSVFVDPETKQEFRTDEPPIVEKTSFQFRKIDGVWKVIDGAQHR